MMTVKLNNTQALTGRPRCPGRAGSSAGPCGHYIIQGVTAGVGEVTFEQKPEAKGEASHA